MNPCSLKNRHRIEQDFHDQWAREIDVEKVLVKESFEAATAIENRRILEILGDLRDKRVLDLGCGAGEAAVYFALKGAQVCAVDISPLMLEKTKALAKRFGVPVRACHMTVETLDFPEGSFDVIYGSSVLHHADVGLAVKSIARVLKKNGTAVFIDPLDYNPIINVYRKIAKDVRTPTEKPLTLKDIDGMKKNFAQVRLEHFWLLAMFVFIYMFFIERVDPGKDRYWKRIIRESGRYQRLFDFLNSLDKKTLRVFPFLGRFCWTTIIILEHKK
jgi:SAM-dependent methyltransferase